MSRRIQAIDCSLDTMKALLWQHDNATRLKALIALKQRWYQENHCEFWTNWVRDVFDVRTANDFGLGVWARILDVSLGVDVPGSREKEAFGLGIHHANFGNGNFARGEAGQLSLTTRQKRLVIRLRYFQLTSRGTVPEINAFLKELFGADGRVFVLSEPARRSACWCYSIKRAGSLLYESDLAPNPGGLIAGRAGRLPKYRGLARYSDLSSPLTSSAAECKACSTANRGPLRAAAACQVFTELVRGALHRPVKHLGDR